jgi:hypothetical protein
MVDVGDVETDRLTERHQPKMADEEVVDVVVTRKATRHWIP